MSVLRRKQEDEAITFKLPVALKRNIEELRGRAESAGLIWRKPLPPRCGDYAKSELDGGPRRGRKVQNRLNDTPNGKLQ